MMEEYIEFLREISTPPKEFDAARFVKSAIDEEILHLRHKSYRGIFHDHVKRYGYPLPQELVDKSAYHSRPTIENKLERAVSKKENIILLGCEGSGKSTLVHYVLGRKHSPKEIRIYIDVSDIEISRNSDFGNILYDKLVNSLANNIPENVRLNFEDWTRKPKNNVFLNSMITTETPKKLVESLITYLRTKADVKSIYLIIDNVDSISISASQTLFNSLNLLNESVRAICKSSNLVDRDNIRYVICCRTPTYNHVNGHTVGLFLDFPHRVLPAEDDFSSNFSPSKMLRTFVDKEKSYIFREHPNRNVRVNLGKVTQTMSISDYMTDILDWIAKSSGVFDKTIKMFCGRSIRRAKLYGIKVFASPSIARLALFEKHDIVQITRADRGYLERRLQEAIFDFPTIEHLEGLGLNGFPMNPFRVVKDDHEYKQNPLVGVTGIDYLVQYSSNIAREDVYFAKSVEVESLIEYFRKIGFSEAAIKDFFLAALDSGLLRPMPSSPILVNDDANGEKSIHEIYILDDRALSHIHDLIFCTDPKISMRFYNAALRSHYKLAGDRVIDNMLVESYCCLIFLHDLIEREIQLEKLMQDSGVMIQTMSSRIRSSIMTYLNARIIESVKSNSSPAKSLRHRDQLSHMTQELFNQISEKIGSRTSLI